MPMFHGKSIDKEFLQGRLVGTHVIYDKELVRVDAVSKKAHGRKGFLFTLTKVVNPSKPFSVDWENKKLDMRHFRLGYVNSNGIAVYLKRSPRRRWKQGLDSHTFNFTVRTVSGSTTRVRQSDLIGTPLQNLLRGEYPTFDKALGMLSNDKKVTSSNPFPSVTKSVAISRDIALTKGAISSMVDIFYRDSLAGWYNCENKHACTIPRKEFLEESFKEVGIPCEP